MSRSEKEKAKGHVARGNEGEAIAGSPPVYPERRLTEPQRRVLEYVRANSGRLYGSSRDFKKIGRRDLVWRLAAARLLRLPRETDTRTWEVSAAGLRALDGGAGGDPRPASASDDARNMTKNPSIPDRKEPA